MSDSQIESVSAEVFQYSDDFDSASDAVPSVHHRRKLFVGPVSAPTFRSLVQINSAPLH